MHRDILLSYVILHHCKKDTQLTMHLFVYYNTKESFLRSDKTVRYYMILLNKHLNDFILIVYVNVIFIDCFLRNIENESI